MARVIGPCCSFEARGAIGNALIFRRRQGIFYVSKYFKPRNPRSPAQTINRARTAAAVERWKAALTSTRAAWNTYAKQFQRRGYNMYVSAFRNYMRDNAEAQPAAPFLPTS